MNKGGNEMKLRLTDFELTNEQIVEKCAKNYIDCIKGGESDSNIRVNSIILHELIGLRLCNDGKTVECYDPTSCSQTIKTWKLEEKLYEFDELDDEASETAIQEYLKSSTMYQEAIDDLRHMKFDLKGIKVRGYDEV